MKKRRNEAEYKGREETVGTSPESKVGVSRQEDRSRLASGGTLEKVQYKSALSWDQRFMQ